MTIEPGKFYSMTNWDYHYGRGKAGLSKSFLSKILAPDGSPRKFKHAIDNPEKSPSIFSKDLREANLAKTFNRGTAFHTYFLEREKFKDTISIIPEDIDRRTNVGKAEWAEYQDKVRENKLTPIYADYMDTLKAFDKMLESGEYDTAKAILQGKDNFTEMSGFWEDPETGILLKTRPDIIQSNMIIWDLKTYASFKSFRNQAINLNYDLQAYMGLEGATRITSKKHTEFAFLVFHIKEEPYDIEVFLCDEDFIISGKEKFDRAIGTYMTCVNEDKWPGCPDEVQILSPPGWRMNQLK